MCVSAIPKRRRCFPSWTSTLQPCAVQSSTARSTALHSSGKKDLSSRRASYQADTRENTKKANRLPYSSSSTKAAAQRYSSQAHSLTAARSHLIPMQRDSLHQADVFLHAAHTATRLKMHGKNHTKLSALFISTENSTAKTSAFRALQ